ncbi:hypothetical protein Sjap_004699 [Stephania japonica]|uniref:Uncharacterized protein n=1 Tax=Stephania japonica TaxID=461633 RepID=A0AAP0K2P0_9MAGN
MAERELSLLWNAKSDMESLASTLTTIQAVLADAETKQFTDNAIKVWLAKLEDAAFKADDILDEWATDESLAPHCSCSSSFNYAKPIMSRRKIAKEIKAIRERIEGIAEERSKFHLSNHQITQMNRETSSFPNEPQIYGRDLDKENIINSLLESQNIGGDGDVSVFPILGMGGLGKTTLAQIVYNDERVLKHFDTRVWYCVSDDFDVKKISKAIVKSVSGCSCGPDDTLEDVQVRLREALRGRRLLLVLDDVWTEKQELWKKFKNSLLSGAKGASIIVTTRLPIVADIAGIAQAYELSPLHNDDCLLLFQSYAFKNVGDQSNQEFMEIGRQIVKKCGGLPLAARALGSLLRSTRDIGQWERIRDSEIWNLPEGKEDTILPALRLSYNYLSPRLRQCFAYCSLFPKDYEMEKEELILIWMANGLIPTDQRTDLGVVGNEIFNGLLWHSMLEGKWRDGDGNVKTCRMHDLLHDLASSILKSHCSHLEYGSLGDLHIPDKARHFSVISETDSELHINQSRQSQQSLRTLMVDCSYPILVDFTHFTCLRTLHMTGAFELSKRLSAIGDLKHLRYLSLVSCRLESLPKSIGKLGNLQILNLEDNDLQALPSSIGDLKKLRYLFLSGNSSLTSLPKSIGGLKSLLALRVRFCGLKALPESITSLHSLRHLHTRGCYDLKGMPNGIGSMTGLQTLSYFKVGEEKRGFAGIRELQGLNLLKGKLRIGLDHVKCVEDARGACLMSKTRLSTLTLWWIYWYEDAVRSRSKEVLEGLQPHPNIKELGILYYPGAEFPTWMQMGDPLSSFPRLSHLSLHSLYNLEEWLLDWKENESLPALQSLELYWCSQLKSLPVQLCNLTSLKSLHIVFCDHLLSLPLELTRLTSLERLTIGHCPSLRSLPCLAMQGQKSSLRLLDIFLCEELTSQLELQHLTALEALQLSDCSKLKYSIQDLHYLTALKFLTVDPSIDLPESVKARVLDGFYNHNLISW